MSDTAEADAPDAEPADTAEADAPDGSGSVRAGAAASEAIDADSAPEVELGLYQVSVRVKGSEVDGLGDVEETATRLIDHLVERAGTLEEEPDQRGLG